MQDNPSFLALLVLGCVFIFAINIVKRAVMKGGGISPTKLLASQMGFAACLYATTYLIFWGFRLPTVAPKFLQAVIGCSIANVFIQWLTVKAASLDKGEVSVTAPLQAMTPFMITLLAITLHEFPGPLGIAGIFCMALGSYYIMWPKQKEFWYDWIGPVYHLRRLFHWRTLEPAERSQTLAITLSIGSAALGTFGLLFESLYIRRAGGIQGLVFGSGTVCLLLSAMYSCTAIVRKAPVTEPAARKRFVWGFTLLGMCFFASWMCIQPGFLHFLTSYVGTLKRLSILLSVVGGILIFKEAKTREQLKNRLWAAALITIGSFLIGWDGLTSKVQNVFEHIGF